MKQLLQQKSTIDWQEVSLDEVAIIVTGNTPPTGNRANYGTQYMFVSPTDLGDTKYVESSEKMLSATGMAQARKIPGGSTLFVCIGSTIGKVGIAAQELATNQQINSLIPKNNVDSEYLFYAATTLSSIVRDQAGEQAVPLVNKSQFSQFKVLLPSLSEQRVIAGVLRDVDNQIATFERLIAKKLAVKQGMMQQLLTGRTRLPGFEEEWVDKRLGEFGQCFRGVGYDPGKDLSSGDRPFTVRLLRSNNVQRGRIIHDDLQYVHERQVSNEQLLKAGDIVICMANGSRDLVGKAALFDEGPSGQRYTFGAFMGAFRTNRTVSDPRFVTAVMYTHSFRSWLDLALSGSSINNLRPSDVERFIAKMPGLDEQRAIGEALGSVDREIGVLRDRLQKARDMKTGMMQQLLTGRVRLPMEATV